MAATKTLLADFKGLVTAPGLLMRAEASFTVAQNVLFDAPGLMRKRPGFSRLPTQTTASIFTLHPSPFLNDKFIAHTGVVSPTALFQGNGTGAWTSIPGIDAASVTRTGPAVPQRLGLLGTSHYLTSGEGVRRVEAALASARYAGMPRGQAPSTANMVLAVILTTASDWLPNGSAVAYRLTWHRLDDSGQELGGPPTGRLTVRNIAGTTGFAAATRSVRVRVPLPYELGTASTALTTSYFFRLWRSRDNATSEPDDELYLVAQQTLTAGDIAAGAVDVIDLTPGTILVNGPRLHTNPVGFPDGEANIYNGQVNADDPPPSANCIASWRNRLWYADTQGKAASTCQLLTVGGTGLVAGDTVSFNGGLNNLTAVAGAPGANQFTVVPGLPTLALSIEATARNIVEAWNLNYGASSEVLAYYVSVGSQQSGIIFLECKQQTPASASGASSRASAWRFGTANTRTGGTNVIQYSKVNRGDACAIINTLTVGNGQTSILQIAPYRDFLVVFTNTGIYAVTGSSSADFNAAPFDLTFRLVGRELVAVADDRVYAWCREGIIELDEGGVRVISTPIEPTVERIMLQGIAGFGTQAQWLDSLAQYGFAVGYRLKHRVMFFYQSNYLYADQGCLDALVFDTRTRAWSTLNFPEPASGIDNAFKSCGVPRFSDDLLVMGWLNPGGGDGRAFVERNSYSNADYQDTDATGASAPVELRATTNFQVVDAGGAVHWQGTVFQLDGGEFSGRATPATFEVGAFTLTGADVVRYETPFAARRSSRYAVAIAHRLATACGFVGISQMARIGTNFPGRA